MTSLPQLNFSLEQIYPGTGRYELNTCMNPDCLNFGEGFVTAEARRGRFALSHPTLTAEQVLQIARHGPGAYRIQGSDDAHKRVSNAFHFAGDPHQ